MATGKANRAKGKGTTKTPPPVKKRARAKNGQGKQPAVQATLLETVKAENPDITSDELAAKFGYPLEEVARYRGFLHEYIKDFNIEAAALRMGYPEITAATTGKLFLYHSYTQLRLQEILDKAEIDSLVSPAKIVAGLVKEAHAPDVAFSSNASTRISAWKALAQIMGLHNPKPKDNTPQIRRVMFVPVPVNWEAGARASQSALKLANAIDV